MLNEKNRFVNQASDQTAKLIQINEIEFKTHLDQIISKSVQETLNTLLEEEADILCQAQK